MKHLLIRLGVGVAAACVAAGACAKLPALSDEAKAKAAEAAAKTAWSGKVDAYQLCKAQDRVAGYYAKSKSGAKDVKLSAKEAKAAAAASTCADPGAFVYNPAPTAAPAPVAAAVPAPVKKP